jgi:hypothetical protein
MPVVNDDEVLGVFELFSGQVNAFGERDVSALRRLSEMVETAVRLAHAAESLPQRLNADPPVAMSDVVSEDVFDDDILEVQSPAVETEVVTSNEDLDLGVPAAEPVVEGEKGVPIVALEMPITPSVASSAQAPQAAPLQEAVVPVEPAPAPKKPMFWSAALNTRTESQTPAEVDQSHVPPVLRNLRKCEACGFPVSAERTLCVECEEKKWRGVPKRTSAGIQNTAPPSSAVATVPTPKVPSFVPLGTDSVAKDAGKAVPTSGAPSAPVAHLMSAAAKSATVVAPKPAMQEAVPAGVTVPFVATSATSPEAKPNQPEEAERQLLTPSVAAIPTKEESALKPAETASEMSSPDFVLSAGLEPSQSWLAANKYIIVVIVVIAAAAAAFVLLH